MGRLADKLKALARRGGPRRFLAVDYDSSQLRIVQAARAGGSVQVRQLLAVAMPAGVDSTDARAVGEFLSRTLKEARLGETSVVLSVPRGQAILKPLTLPSATGAGELPGMVRFQMEKQLPFAAAEAVIDFTIDSHYGAEEAPQVPGTDVLAAAVRLPVLEHYRQIALFAGLKLMRLGLRPYATACFVNGCLSPSTRSQCLAVVNLTADEAEIDVLEGSSLTFSRSIVGRIAPRPTDEQAVREAVENVVTEVVRSLQSYQYRGMHRASIEPVLVTGGTGLEQKVAEALGRRLEVACRTLDPAFSLNLDAAQARNASSFATAVGLAVGADRPGGFPFDFLNPKRPPVQRDKRKDRVAAVAAGVAAIVLSAASAGGYYLAGKKAHRDDLARAHQKQQETVSALEAAGYEKRAKAIEEWQQSACPWTDHVALLSGLFPPRAEAYTDLVETEALGRSITFTLYAHTQEAITDLTGRLEKAGYSFSAGAVATRKDPRYMYTVRYKLTVPRKMNVDLTSQPAIEAASSQPAAEAASPPAEPAPPAAEEKAPPPSEAKAPPSSDGKGRTGGQGKSGRSDKEKHPNRSPQP